MTRIALTVNGTPVAADVAPRTHLADFLREELLLTGTHIGCEHGICGACTVEIDGEIARSCITYAVACDGAHVRSIESFDDDPLMARLRRAFSEAHALQCGYCTPGMLIAARDLVRRKRGLSRADIRNEMGGNLCRCTGYAGIIDAIEQVMADAPPSSAPRARGEGRGEGQLQDPDIDAERGNAWLGPAPGPGAASVPSGPRATPPAAEPSHAAPLALPNLPPRTGQPIAVTVGEIEDAGGLTRLAQSFVLPHPRAEVWALMSDVERMARCMPGLTLDGPPRDGEVAGRLEARIGPIAASFAGTARITRVADEFRQLIEGRGGDRRSGSQAQGSVDCRLTPLAAAPGSEATRVDIVLGYAIAGPLAQFGRGGLVRDLVRRIGEAFAQNVDAELRAPGGVLPQRQLGGLSLVAQVIADRVRAWAARLLGRAS